MPDFLSIARQLREQRDEQDADVLERLSRAYTAMYGRLSPRIDALIARLELAVEREDTRNVRNLPAYRDLIAETERELEQYSGYLRTELDIAARASAETGYSNGRALILAALVAYMGVNSLPTAVTDGVQTAPNPLDFLSDYLDPRGPLFNKIQSFAGYYATNVADGFLEKVALGWNPLKIGDWFAEAYGMALTDALRMTRTTQIWSYRRAAHENYQANADILQGWVWYANLGGNPCMSCISLHGSVHPVDEILDDHHNGECTALPLVAGQDNPVTQSGEDWFSAQNEAKQRDLMGPGRLEAWQDGKFEFGQLSSVRDDPVFGQMRVETPLKDLVSE